MAKRSGKSPGQRQLRVGEELRHALAELLARGDLRDPDLSGASITVTEVRVSPDLRSATAFVVPLGGGDATALLAGLRRAAPYLRTRVARLVRLKFAPQFTFQADATFDHASRIDALIEGPFTNASPPSVNGDDSGAA